jgi:hypothetical protein
MPAYTELYIDQGATFNEVILLTDDTTNTPINVLGYIVTSQIRRSYNSANASGNITCTITNAANGEITLSMTSANTANMKAGRFFFDVKTLDVSDVTTRILEGLITITPSITRE